MVRREVRALRLSEEAFALFEEKIDVHERFVADVLPQHVAVPIDQEGSVERFVFEIVVCADAISDQ